jgi:cysteinyl-tRNA synthetase
MSKSLGNFFTLRDLLEKGYPGVVVRYLLISTHYRQQLNFTFDGLEAAKKSLERLWDFHDSVEAVKGGTDNPQVEELVSEVKRKFVEALDDDLNVSPALAAVFDFVRDVNRLISEGNLSENDAGKVLDAVNGFDNVLAFLKREKSDASLEDEVEQLIQQRIDARKNKDFATADKIRDDLLERGIILEDTPQGTKWKRKL